MSFWDTIKELFGNSDAQETLQKVPIEEVQQQLEDATRQAGDAVESAKDQAAQTVEDAKDHIGNQ